MASAYSSGLFNSQIFSSKGYNSGIDLRTSADAIPDDALVDATNMEFDAQSGLFRTAWGLTEVHTPTGAMDYNTRGKVFNGKMLYNCGQTLYSVPLASMNDSATSVGSLLGTKAPSFDIFKDTCQIASGGKLQKLTDAFTLSTISGSATACDKVWNRFGRVRTVAAGDDYVNYSALYNVDSWDIATEPKKDWTSAGDLDPAYIEIGLGDGCDIVGVGFLGPDELIFKRGTLDPNITKAYRLIGEPFQWTIPVAANNIDCKNLWSVVDYANECWVLGKDGLKGIQNVSDYGDTKQNEAGSKINATLSRNTDQYASLWRVNSRKQIWIKAQNDNRIWLFHPLQYSPVTQTYGAFTTYDFGFNVVDVVESGSNVYIFGNDKIYKLVNTIAPAKYSFEGKTVVGMNPFVLDRIRAIGSGYISGNATVYVGGTSTPVSYGGSQTFLIDDTDFLIDDSDIIGGISSFTVDKRKTKRVNSFSARVEGTGSAGFMQVSVVAGEG